MRRSFKFVCLGAACLALALPALAEVPATPAAVPLIATPVLGSVAVRGEISSMIGASQDLGRVADTMALPQLTLILKRPAARQAALDRLVAHQLTRGDPAYGRWVRPEELFAAFGPAPADIARVTAWLAAQGFAVHGVSADGMTIAFAGSARQVEDAFQTEMHRLSYRGEAHFANMREPMIPRAFVDVVTGITLHNFFPRPASHGFGKARQDAATGQWRLSRGRPDFISPITPFGTFQAIGANDFTKIYDVDPLRAGNAITGSPLTGAGAAIIVLEDTDTQLRDWARYRHIFGLDGYKGTLSITHPGRCGDPGINQDEVEAALDVDVGSMSAPDANVILASCPSANFNTNSGLFTALENLVSLGTPAQVISISYGFCEAGYGPTALAAWSQATEEGAAEGLSIFVSSGDNGVAGCDNDNTQAVSTLGLAVNGLASNPYVTAVGGTDFSDEVIGTGRYFAPHNRPGLETALSYVPEIVWSDSCASSVLLQVQRGLGNTTAHSPIAFCNSAFGQNFLDLVAGGGGHSAVYPKPYWQSLTVAGMPEDGVRDLPDVAMFASSGFYGHFTLFCDSSVENGSVTCDYHNPATVLYGAIGGTSVAAPSMAGIMLLETQYQAEQQGKTAPVRSGNVAPRLYELAAIQFNPNFEVQNCDASLGNAIGAACIFHNVTLNNNAAPCAKGSANCYTDKESTQGIGVLSDLPGGKAAYPAQPGYSLATGLGSVDALKLIAAY